MDTRSDGVSVSQCPHCGAPLEEITFLVDLRAPMRAADGRVPRNASGPCEGHGASGGGEKLFEQEATACCPNCYAPRRDLKWSHA